MLCPVSDRYGGGWGELYPVYFFYFWNLLTLQSPQYTVRWTGTGVECEFYFRTSRDMSQVTTRQAVSGRDYVAVQSTVDMLTGVTRVAVQVAVLAVSLSLCQCVCLFVCLCLSVCLFVRPSVHPSVCPSVRPSVWDNGVLFEGVLNSRFAIRICTKMLSYMAFDNND